MISCCSLLFDDKRNALKKLALNTNQQGSFEAAINDTLCIKTEESVGKPGIYRERKQQTSTQQF